MSSILTNSSAMTALQNLAMTQKSLTTTQAQISSGLKVANASDNAAYWSISTSMKADTSAMSAVTDALNLGASVVSTATSAMNAVESILQQMQKDIVTAQTSGTDKTQVQTDILAQQQSLKSIMQSASFNGVNLLDGSTASTNIVSSFSRNSAGTTSTGTLSINTSGIALAGGGTSTYQAASGSGSTATAAGWSSTQSTGGGLLGASLTASSASGSTGLTTTYLIADVPATTGSTPTADVPAHTASSDTTPAAGDQRFTSGAYAADSILGFDLSNASPTDLTVLANGIASALTKVTAGAAKLGQYTTTINNQLTVTSSISDAITSGVGSLVDADMNVASTRLQALQTQQQLGIQALSIANQNSQLILKLFQG